MKDDTFKDGGTGVNTLSGGLGRYIDYDVIDESNHKVGKLNSLWVDRAGHPLFLGIKTGLVFGKTHVVPTEAARLNQGDQSIRLPYSEDTIKGAPAFDVDKDLEVENEREVYRYFNMGETGTETRRFETTAAGAGMATTMAAPAPPPLTTPPPLATTPAPAPAPAPEPLAEDEGKLFLSEEWLKVGKKVVDAGGVRLRKIVRTEKMTLPVDLSHEEIVIERVPAAQGTQPAAVDAFTEKDIFVSLHREEPVVSKESRVKEEIRCRKQPHTEKRSITDSIRKEDLEILNVKDSTELNRLRGR